MPPRIFYFIGNTVIHSCVKVELSYEIKNAPRGCAARGKENIALRTARARRISQARFFFSVRLAAQRKRGYERRIDDVIPMNAENAWIWQVETNVNLKKVDVL